MVADAETVLKIADIVVPAVAGLAGVLVGSWIALRGQKEERRQAWLRRQLDEFYSPMLGLRARILARSESRQRVSQASLGAWPALFEGASIPQQIELERQHSEEFGRIIEHDNRVLFEELLPMYRKMIDLFTDKMGLAEPATRAHFSEFVHFVDIWDRSEKKTLPAEVSRVIGHSEAKVHPFYKDLEDNVQRLQQELKK